MRAGSVALTLSLVIALLGGCAGPSERFAARASALGFGAARVEGEGFAHVVYRPAGLRPDGGRVLHIYLDGDGTPWERGRPAADPTPREPLVLRLMALDRAPSAYLGGPAAAHDDRPQGDRLARLQRRRHPRDASCRAHARDGGRGHGGGQSRRGGLGGAARPVEASRLAQPRPAPAATTADLPASLCGV